MSGRSLPGDVSEKHRNTILLLNVLRAPERGWLDLSSLSEYGLRIFIGQAVNPESDPQLFDSRYPLTSAVNLIRRRNDCKILAR